MTLRLNLLLCAAALAAAAVAPAFQSKDLIGQPAPLKALGKAVTGKPGPINLDDYKGKIVVLDFWATWCGPCIQSMPHLNELVAAFKGQPVEFIALSDESPERIGPFLKEKQAIDARVATDETQAALKAYRVVGIPTTFIIDRSGVILDITHPMNLDAAAIKSALEGSYKPIVPEVKPPTVNPNGRKTVAEILGFQGKYQPGQDPVYGRDDLYDLIDWNNYQTILRRAIFDLPSSMSVEGNGVYGTSIIAQPAKALFAFVFNKKSHAILIDEGVVDEDAKWDLIVNRLRDSSADTVRKELRPIMESYFNVTFTIAPIEREVWVVKAGPKASEVGTSGKDITDVDSIVEFMNMSSETVIVDSAAVGKMPISLAPFYIGQSFESIVEAVKKQGFDVVKEKRTIDGVRVSKKGG